MGLFFSVLGTDFVTQSVVELLPQAQLLPLAEVMVNQSPWRKVVRNISPRAPGFGDILDRVEDLALFIARRSPKSPLLGKEGAQDFPFTVADVAVVRLSGLHPKLCTRNVLQSTDIYSNGYQ